MTEVVAHLDHARSWEAASRGQPVDWDELFKGYQRPSIGPAVRSIKSSCTIILMPGSS